MKSLPCAAVLAAMVTFAPATAKWLEVDSEHFRVVSDATPTKLAEIVQSLDAFRAVVAKSTSGLALSREQRLTFYVFKNDASFDPFKTRPDLLGFFAPTPERQIAALNATPPQNVGYARQFKSFEFPYMPVFHEYTQALLRDTFESLPAWVEEGMAEYFSTFWYQGKKAEVGHASRMRMPELANGFPIPLQKLVERRNFDGLNPTAVDAAYAESWIVVHTLMRGSPERRKQFSAFLTELLAGTRQSEAFAKAFGISWSQLEAEALAHLKEQRFEIVVYPVDQLGLNPVPEPVEIDPRQVDDELGELVALTRTDRLEVAEAHFEAALAAEPKDARALAGLGLVAESRKKPDGAVELYQKALAIDPEDPITHFRFGRNLMVGTAKSLTPLPPTAPMPARISDARSHLLAALLARPDLDDATYLYGLTFLSDPGDRSSGIASLRAHLQARPGSWDTAEALGLLLLWSGDEEGALKLLDSRAGLHANVERVGEYRKTVFTALKLTVRTRADKDGPAAASAWVSGLLASTQDEPARAQLQSWITKLDAAVAPPSPSSR
jgi:tetratricopeptide (TPR) repeat protein